MWRGFFRPYNLRSSSIPLIRNIHGAAVPQIVGFVANLTFVPLYASRCLNLPLWSFYPIYLQYITSTIVSIVFVLFFILC